MVDAGVCACVEFGGSYCAFYLGKYCAWCVSHRSGVDLDSEPGLGTAALARFEPPDRWTGQGLGSCDWAWPGLSADALDRCAIGLELAVAALRVDGLGGGLFGPAVRRPGDLARLSPITTRRAGLPLGVWRVLPR